LLMEDRFPPSTESELKKNHTSTGRARCKRSKPCVCSSDVSIPERSSIPERFLIECAANHQEIRLCSLSDHFGVGVPSTLDAACRLSLVRGERPVNFRPDKFDENANFGRQIIARVENRQGCGLLGLPL